MRQRLSSRLSDYDQDFLLVPEAAAILRISRAACYAYLRSGALPEARIGKRVVVPRAALERLAAGTACKGPDDASV